MQQFLRVLALCKSLYAQGRLFLNKKAIIRVAIEYAKQQGRHVEDYDVAWVSKERDAYWVRFEGKTKLPGNHFTVWIDVATGRAIQLVPGK